MRPNPLHRVITSLHLGDDRIQLIAVQRAAIPNLPSGLCIKRCVIENDLAFFARLELLHALTILDDGQHFAIFRARLQVAFKN